MPAEGGISSEALPPVALIETLRWERGSGYVLLDRHLSRLAASAAFFAIEHDADAARMALLRATWNLAGDRWRVRLMLDEDGEITVSAQPLRPLAEPLCCAVSDRPVSATGFSITRRRVAGSTTRSSPACAPPPIVTRCCS